MRDFARYVILSPVMSATAATAMAGTIPFNQSGGPCRDPGNVDHDTLGLDGKPVPSKAEHLGLFVRRSRAEA